MEVNRGVTVAPSRAGRATRQHFALRAVMLACVLFALPAFAQTGTGGSGGTNGGTTSGGTGAQANWSAVQANLGGWKGEVRPSGVLKISFVNESVGNINVGGTSLKPGMLAHGFLAFSQLPAATPSGATGGATAATTANTLVVGEFPVREANASKLVKELARQGITVPAVHKHALGEDPRLAFVHIEEAGDGATIAKQIVAAVGAAGIPLREETKVSPSTLASGLDLNALQSALSSVAPLSANGASSTSGLEPIRIEASPGILSIEMPRAETFRSCAAALFNARQAATTSTAGGTSTTAGSTGATATAGVGNNTGAIANAFNTCLSTSISDQLTAAGGTTSTSGGTSGAANQVNAEAIGAVFEFRIQPLGNGRAAVVAEMPLLATEVRDTEQMLANVKTVEITFGEAHNHTLTESPRLAFMHAATVGGVSEMVNAVKAALQNNAGVAQGQPSAAGGSGGNTGGTTGTSGGTSGGTTGGGSGPGM